MKKIYFIRHAKATKETNNDFDRDLNDKGKINAKFMGKRLKKHSVIPDMIFSSPAKRAIKTANLISKEIGYKKDIKTVKELYEASLESIFKFLNSLNDELNSVFIIGHNPSLTEICEFLSDSDIGNIPTSGIFCIEFEGSFEHIKESHAHALFFDYPKKH
ncbi:histidine phosphatase family protein [Campylobacter fetus]|uniref:Phosphohistidine phosphatase n=3 Tax=Campylobacter fetus TaxID=196 RepID=A0AAE6IZI0_CAMFE|nr:MULTISPECIES: histidine phosphatase family protein [Campylobacter]OCS23327.1 histidine phosphatase [Campylobacter fetus subsp. venerealis cfvi97/532]OCS25498.1 histidine phosphatase [Campylobacter fetus subsp. venerealis cfvB10]OCS30694.1 histidine phosphatase [Campylobacter fetus subsp. venerealis LMG 6570 = CCUG 33900]OCS38732.1 histidine phosphatase [Campylobacter fetus subsp. venerealis cfvi02/298]ABK83101.1 phosphohistidine phosphatase SixA [Campylobacter fetus subsp. fetus 82-40]